MIIVKKHSSPEHLWRHLSIIRRMTPCHTSRLLAAFRPSIVCSRCLRRFLHHCNIHVYNHVHAHVLVVYACVDDVLVLDVQDMWIISTLMQTSDCGLQLSMRAVEAKVRAPSLFVVCLFVCLFVCEHWGDDESNLGTLWIKWWQNKFTVFKVHRPSLLLLSSYSSLLHVCMLLIVECEYDDAYWIHSGKTHVVIIWCAGAGILP